MGSSNPLPSARMSTPPGMQAEIPGGAIPESGSKQLRLSVQFFSEEMVPKFHLLLKVLTPTNNLRVHCARCYLEPVSHLLGEKAFCKAT